MRTVGCPCPFVQRCSPEHSPPTLQSATFNAAGYNLRLTFDQPLISGEVDPGLFIVRDGTTEYQGDIARAGTPTAYSVDVLCTALGPYVTSPGTDYHPPPYDLKALDGTPVEPYDNAPLVVV